MSWQPPEHDRQTELRDHLSVEEWRVPIDLIAQRHDLDRRGLFPFATGSDIVWSAGAHVVKLTAPCWVDEIAAEASALARVQGRLSLASPELHARGELEGWPYVVMGHVPGEAIGELWAGTSNAERVRLAGELGELTRELHALGDESEAQAWPHFWAKCCEGVAARHEARGAPAKWVRQIDGFLDAVGTLEPQAFGFLHTELLDAHILARREEHGVQLCGLIDFADSCVGPVDYEFAAPIEFLFKGEPGALRAFLLGYGESESALDLERSKRLLAWALCHRFGSLPRILAACGPDAPDTLEGIAGSLYAL